MNKLTDEQAQALLKEHEKVGQIIAQALGYPWYYHDQKNFPGSTIADGVCIGCEVPETLAIQIADKYKRLEQENKELKQAIKNLGYQDDLK